MGCINSSVSNSQNNNDNNDENDSVNDNINNNDDVICNNTDIPMYKTNYYISNKPIQTEPEPDTNTKTPKYKRYQPAPINTDFEYKTPY